MHHMREGLTKARNKKKKAMQTAREHPGGLFMPKHTKTFRCKKFSKIILFSILYMSLKGAYIYEPEGRLHT